MKAEVPKKIYVHKTQRWGLMANEHNITKNGIEYTCTDAFIKKACEAFCKVRCNDKPPRSTCTSLGTCTEHDKFRKALKGE